MGTKSAFNLMLSSNAIRVKRYVGRRPSVFQMEIFRRAEQDRPRQYANLCVSILRSPKIMFRSLAIRAGLLCFVLAPLATVASAQLKIAVVNVQKAMLDSDELKKVSAEVEAKYKPKQDELLKLQNDLQSIQQQLQSNKLTPQAQQDLQLQGQRKQRDAQRLSDDLQQEFDRDRQDILGKAAQKMTEVVKKLAEEKGFDIVIDVSQSLYFKPALDVTADALAAYNKAYPVTK
jgi:outer membrane protein